MQRKERVHVSLDGWRLIAITLDYPHHASGSGYGQLARQIEFDSIVTPPTGVIAKGYDRWVRLCQANRMISRITRRRTATEVRYLLKHFFRGRRIVHVFYGEHHSWLLRAIRKGRSERRVMTIHLPPSLWHVSFKPGQLNKFDGVILMSESQMQPLRNQLKYQGKVEVIPHGVDTMRFSFVKRQVPTDTIQCITVGNFLRDYEALARVAKAAEGKPIKFHVVANPEAAKPLTSLTNVELHYGISDARLLELYQSSHLAVFTMQDCTANNAILEAMATGLPILANGVGGIHTYVKGEVLTVIDVDDPAGSVAKILDLTSDPSRYEAISASAREQSEDFSWSTIVERVRRFYSEAVHGE
ncbi:MAG: glycosyltransferase family 4 protein [Chlorobia bacterium]|nr:glycosyltransferase family 4 protein [Fimbriimonadaceae bacterium]